MHVIDARQMAYDLELHEVVRFLDAKSNAPILALRHRMKDPLLRQPIAPFEPAPLDEALNERLLIEPEQALELIAIERKRIAEEKIARELEMAEMRLKARRSKEAAAAESVKSDQETSNENNSVHDELDKVFGPDIAYRMNRSFPMMLKHDHKIPDVIKHYKPVSIRGTKASHLMHQVNTNKAERLRILRNEPKRGETDSDSTVTDPGRGKHTDFRRWPHPRSAPQLRNSSMESLPDCTIRHGRPFLHGEDRRLTTPDSSRLTSSRRGSRSARSNSAKSAHSTVSPFSQVAKLLEQSRLFSPLLYSSTPSSRLPNINNKQNKASHDVNLTKTKINYIYADRGSARSRCGPDLSPTAPDMLPKRKLKC